MVALSSMERAFGPDEPFHLRWRPALARAAAGRTPGGKERLHGSLLVEPQHGRIAEEDKVAGRIAERRIDGQHRDLKGLARLGTVGQLDFVGSVETADGAAAGA